MAYNEREKERTIAYQREKLDRITIWVQKGKKDPIKAHAQLMGESMQLFIQRAIAETIERDRERIAETMRGLKAKTKGESKPMGTVYSYKELCEKARSHDATQADINALGEWFEKYGADYWNGEYFDASLPGEPSGTCRLYPVEERDGELDVGIVTGYEFR